MDERDSDNQPIRINNKRYLNVIFGEVVKPKLAERGKTLSKEELQEKICTDQDLHETVIDEYNSNKVAYRSHAFSDIADFQDGTVYQPIPRSVWRKSNNKFKELTGELENGIISWARSGTHNDFADVVPGGVENTVPSMVCMHHLLMEAPRLINKCLGMLPDNVFSVSSSGAPTTGGKRKNSSV